MGDYISKEYIINKFKEHRELYVSYWDDFKSMPMADKVACDVYAACCADVVNAPAADVQPVKHARWIIVQGKYGDDFLCSNCGTAEKTESGEDGAVWYHDEYCRKCGARMDGDTE